MKRTSTHIVHGAISVATAGILMTYASVSTAQQWDQNAYIGVQGGLSILQDSSITSPDGLASSFDFDNGFVIGGVAGYRLFENFRIEAEVSYRNNDTDKLAVVGDGGLGTAVGLGDLDGQTFDTRGDIGALSGMVNLWYDVPVAARLPVTPYLGGGIGVAKVDVDSVRLQGRTLLDDDDTAFAWQIGGGVRYPLTSLLTLSLDYRYFSTVDINLESVVQSEFDSEYDSHNLLLGLSVSF